jgi:hypothetical protein
VASSVQVLEAGSVTRLSFFAVGGSTAQRVIPALYDADSSGTPTTLRAAASAVTVVPEQSWGWVAADLPATAVGPGRYAVVLVVADATSGVRLGFDPRTGAGATASATSPPASWGPSTATDQAWSVSVSYTPTDPAALAAPAASVPPAITGTPQRGVALTASTGTWVRAETLAVRWERCDATVTTCTPIPGATATTYVPVGADVGSHLRIVVTAANPAHATTATTAATAAVAAGAAGALQVQVGYANNVTLPSPWYRDAGVAWVGTPPSCCTSDNLLGWDAGAVRLVNPSGSPVTVDRVTVGIGPQSWDLWGAGLVVPAGGSLVLTQTTDAFNFDTSELYRFGCYPRVPDIPVVHVTIAGATTDYRDGAQVLNTGGTDGATCAYAGTWFEEGHDWMTVS